MDTLSLATTNAIAAFIMMLVMFLLLKVSKDDKYLVDWTFAGSFFFLYAILASLSAHITLHPLIFPAVINSLFMAGHAAVLSGISRLLFGRSCWKLILVVAIVSYIAQQFPFLRDSVNNRLMFFYLFICAIYVAGISVLWKSRYLESGRALKPLMWVMTAYATQLILRAPIIIFEDSLTIFGSEFIQTSGTLAVLGLFFTLTLCFTFIFFWKKELHLRNIAMTDHLTGWLNRTALSTLAKNITAACNRDNSKVGFLVLDIDYFKQINDNFGHSFGDSVIKEVCRRAKSQIRTCDFAFRLGGEEFLILVKNANEHTLQTLSERILYAINSSKIMTGNNSIRVSASIGFALSDETEERWESTLDKADKALYHSKETGRNKATNIQSVLKQVATSS